MSHRKRKRTDIILTGGPLSSSPSPAGHT